LTTISSPFLAILLNAPHIYNPYDVAIRKKNEMSESRAEL